MSQFNPKESALCSDGQGFHPQMRVVIMLTIFDLVLQMLRFDGVSSAVVDEVSMSSSDLIQHLSHLPSVTNGDTKYFAYFAILIIPKTAVHHLRICVRC